MKLNYSSLQHAVDPVELPVGLHRRCPPRLLPVLVLPLHGHLAPAAWSAGAGRRGSARVGFVQAGGGGLPGSLSSDVRELRERGLIAGTITARPSFGGEQRGDQPRSARCTPRRSEPAGTR